MPHQESLRASYYRGGTSRALVVHGADLPTDESRWPIIFQQILGSPDPYGRQLDGIGAGISSLSKVCVVSPSQHEDADVDYTFYAVGIKEDEVDTAGNCGNMSAAIGPFAYDSGIVSNVSTVDSKAVVVIFNTNTGKIIESTFRVEDGKAATTGKYSISGVAGTSAPIQLDFLRPGGAKTGKILPTSVVTETMDGLQVSCIDAGNPCVFVDSKEVGVDPSALPQDLAEMPDLLSRLEKLRHRGAVAMGIIQNDQTTPRTIPKLGLVSAALSYKTLMGDVQDGSKIDVKIQFISDRQPHRAIPLTAAICSAAAACLPGSVVAQQIGRSKTSSGDSIVIGHASGSIEVAAVMDGELEIESVTVYRTARRLIKGEFFYSGLPE